MKKSKNLKRIGAVMLSLVLAVSTVFTTTAVSEKKVSAQAEIKNKKQLQRWALATKLLSDGEKYFDQTKADNKISDKTAAIYTAIEYIWNEDGNTVPVNVFCDSVKNYFAGCDFNAEKLAAIGENNYFEYKSGDSNVTLKTMQAGGGTQECTYIGEKEHTDGSKSMDRSRFSTRRSRDTILCSLRYCRKRTDDSISKIKRWQSIECGYL